MKLYLSNKSKVILLLVITFVNLNIPNFFIEAKDSFTNLKEEFIDYSKFDLKHLQSNVFNETDSLAKIYENYCENYTANEDINEINDENFLSLSRFYRVDDDYVKSLLNLLESNVDFNVDIKSYIKIVIPFIILIVIAFLTWITCCFCSCYDYCVFICKNPAKEKDQSTKNKWKWIPLVILIFFAMKSIIPLIISLEEFGIFEERIHNSFCLYLRVLIIARDGKDKLNSHYIYNGYKVGFMKKLIENVDNKDESWLNLNTESLKIDDILNESENFTKFIDNLPNNTNLDKEKKKFEIYDLFRNYSEVLNKKPRKIVHSFMIDFNRLSTNFTSYKKDFKNFVEKYQKKYINDLKSLKDGYEKLKNNKEYLIEILKNIRESYLKNQDIITFFTNFSTIFFFYGYNVFHSFLSPFQTFYVIYQILVGIIVLVKVALAYFNIKLNVFKYVSHMLWFFSAIFVIIGLCMLAFLYFFGNFHMVLGNIIYSNIDDNLNNDADLRFSSCLKEYSPNNFNLNKSQFDNLRKNNLSKYGDDIDSYNKQIIQSLNDLSMSTLSISILSSENPFEQISLLKQIRGYVLNLTDPYNAILDENQNSLVQRSVELFNQILNDNGKYPMNTLLSCDEKYDIQFFFDDNYCDYIFSNKPNVNDRSCYLIQNITIDELKKYLNKNSINCNCERFISDKSFCDGFKKTTVANYTLKLFIDLKDFYNTYKGVVNDIVEKILFSFYDNYNNLSLKVWSQIKLIQEKFINIINKSFGFSLKDLVESSKKRKINFLNIKEIVNLELTKYVSCNWFNEYSKHLISEIYYLMISLHAVFICFSFIVIFNIPIGIIMLISIICSDNEEEIDEINKKRKNI